MPRGRHRHSPPLHRLLPPSAIAGVSVVCALGPWLFTEPPVLRGLAGAAAATAVVGAFVMRRWDIQAGKQVADLTRARAGDEWRFEERVAELETDLDESRELRGKLEQRLRAKRTELAGLRNEHAALLRRYATAETERASALEGRRLLEIESGTAGGPVDSSDTATPALPAARTARDDTGATAAEAAEAAGKASDTADVTEATGEIVSAPKVFSPEGAWLFLRAQAALAKLGKAAGSGDTDGSANADGAAAGAESATEDEAEGKPEAVDEHEHAHVAAATPATPEVPVVSEASGSAALVPRPPVPTPVRRPAGHFAVPTAVAVVPATAPVRRPTAEGGFDFFGTKDPSDAPEPEEEARNLADEDLADVVGQEALALHEAETEGEFRPAGEESRAVGQVIDLTAHDETEQIDLQQVRRKELRSAVS